MRREKAVELVTQALNYPSAVYGPGQAMLLREGNFSRALWVLSVRSVDKRGREVLTLKQLCALAVVLYSWSGERDKERGPHLTKLLVEAALDQVRPSLRGEVEGNDDGDRTPSADRLDCILEAMLWAREKRAGKPRDAVLADLLRLVLGWAVLEWMRQPKTVGWPDQGPLL